VHLTRQQALEQVFGYGGIKARASADFVPARAKIGLRPPEVR